MSYAELAAQARGKTGPHCHACPVCDGRACGSTVPGPGAKGTGTVARRNYEAWQGLRVNMDTLHAAFEPSVGLSLFGRELSMPVLVGPVGDIARHYDPAANMTEYNRDVLAAAHAKGTLALTGDGLDASIFSGACEQIAALDGCGIPTVKPWAEEVFLGRLGQARAAHPVALAMDVDAAGLPFLKGQNPPAGFKSVEQLGSIISSCDVPFVVKGVMSPRVAEKAVRAGASAIVVSNHGGRVLDGVPATAEVLPSIVSAVGDRADVLVDGGIRSGLDVFRALALGARAVLVCRPVVVSWFGGGAEGISSYLAQLAAELADVMEMCGAATLDDISGDMLW